MSTTSTATSHREAAVPTRPRRRSRLRQALAGLAVSAVAATSMVAGGGSAAAMSPPQSTYQGVVDLLGTDRPGSVKNFWIDTMASWGQQYASPELYWLHAKADTACGPLATGNSYYCGNDNRIYLDRAWNQQLLDGYGDNAAGGILAHEWGHAVSAWLGTGFRGVREEHFADCLAGMYANYGYATGLLDGSDATEMYNLLSAQAPSDSHGQGPQRAQAYNHGFVHYNLEACVDVSDGVVGGAVGDVSGPTSRRPATDEVPQRMIEMQRALSEVSTPELPGRHDR